jgi:ubiquitin thioesterase protein OTUB1
MAASAPLVSREYPINILFDAIEVDSVMYKKLQKLAPKYRAIRRIRPDGNCLYRALFVGFVDIHTSVGSIPDLKNRFDSLAQECKKLGYDSFAIDEFHELVQEQLDLLIETPPACIDSAIFSDQSIDGYIIAFMRCLCGTGLKKWSDEYISFLPEPYTSIESFCRNEVDPMFKDADQLQIVALSRILNVAIRIVYLDQSTGAEANVIDFGDSSKPQVHLLYRPGHYDLIFPEW